MTKKVNPPSSYRVPILPTLAAMGLGLLALPACSKSGQETYTQTRDNQEAVPTEDIIGESPPSSESEEVAIPSDLQEVVVPVIEALPPTDPEEEVVVPVEEEYPPPTDGKPPIEPRVKKPPKVRPEKPPTVRLSGSMRLKEQDQRK